MKDLNPEETSESGSVINNDLDKLGVANIIRVDLGNSLCRNGCLLLSFKRLVTFYWKSHAKAQLV